MFRWLGDVLKKVLINVVTLAIIGGLGYWFILKPLLGL